MEISNEQLREINNEMREMRVRITILEQSQLALQAKIEALEKNHLAQDAKIEKSQIALEQSRVKKKTVIFLLSKL